jgi:tRNA threonylcarbamoyladenosine biosynthesis protein TsaE
LRHQPDAPSSQEPAVLLISTNGADETRAVAAALGCRLRAGDVVSLTGDLGAGKTTFTQGLASGLGIPDDVVVNSPTFTILAEHLEGREPLYHFDVYRLTGVSDLYDLAFDEYLDGSGVVVVEWADRIAEALPSDTLYVHLEFSLPTTDPIVGRASLPVSSKPQSTDAASVRVLRLTASGQRSTELIRALEASP